MVTGYGQIDGRTVYVYAQDFTVYGGTLSEMQSHKICRVMDLALRNGVPMIGLIDSGGARIQDGVRSLGGYAEIFRRNAQYSGVIPQISVMLGPCAGGAAYSPALTDLIIMVEKHSYMFLTGPEVIKAVTGEIIDPESLGGTRDPHLGQRHGAPGSGQRSRGAGPLPASAQLPALEQRREPALPARRRMTRCAWIRNSTPSSRSIRPRPTRCTRSSSTSSTAGSFLEIQPAWARNAIVGLARMGGHSVGIVAQEPSVMAGVIDIDASDKITRFVRMCDCFNIPLVTFVDSPGFLPGVDQEHRGIIRHGAKVLYAYSEATVPKISVITRKAYGGAYVVMSSKYLGTDVNYAWPSAEIAVLGAEGAANILFRQQIDAAPDPAAERARLADDYRQQVQQPVSCRLRRLRGRHHRTAGDAPQGHRHAGRAARQVLARAAAQARQHPGLIVGGSQRAPSRKRAQ